MDTKTTKKAPSKSMKHKIKAWLDSVDKDRTWLANKLKITESRLSRIISGEYQITLHEAMQIAKLSKNRIKPAHWIEAVK